MLSNPRILCIIPVHPKESSNKTVDSVNKQTVSVSHVELLTEVIKDNIPFPAKMSKVINNYLEQTDLSQYDVLHDRVS